MPSGSDNKAGQTSRELIPNWLAWAPEQKPPPGSKSIVALDLCRHGASKKNAAGKYEVRHYDRDSCGRAFGPLGLESLLRFCRGLEVKLYGLYSGSGALLVTTPEGNEKYRANAAVLVGAYLILRHSWSAARIADCFGKEDADAGFTCSWARWDQPAEDPVMHVRDCLLGGRRGGEAALLDRHPVRQGRLQEHLDMYDSAWLIPGRRMVGADPMTVVSKSTQGGSAKKHYSVMSNSSDSTAFAQTEGKCESDSDSNSFPKACQDTPCHSVSTDSLLEHNQAACKGKAEENETDEEEEEDCGDFSCFLRQSGIRLIVRADADYEHGISHKKGYRDHGIAQANIRMVDHNGAPPRPWNVRRMLQECEDYMQNKGTDAVMVHCKGGFGRSAVLACCLAISRWDIPGSALLGWVRIVRPGAVTTQQQELFLTRLKGSRDVHHIARLPVVVTEDYKAGVKVSCAVPCHIQ